MVALKHRFRVVSRSGGNRWTPEALASWVEVVTGQTVEVQATGKSSWLSPRKVVTFDLLFSGTLEEAQAFMQLLQQHLKVEPVSG